MDNKYYVTLHKLVTISILSGISENIFISILKTDKQLIQA